VHSLNLQDRVVECLEKCQIRSSDKKHHPLSDFTVSYYFVTEVNFKAPRRHYAASHEFTSLQFCFVLPMGAEQPCIAHRRSAISSWRSIHSVMDAMAISAIHSIKVVSYQPCWDPGDTGNQLPAHQL